jgi:predicted nucleic acid-binding protein
MNSEENYIDLDESIFFDSYAFFEILKGNKNYFKYSNFKIVTSKLNLFELYLGLLREVGEEKAQAEFDKYYNFAVDFDKDVIVSAAKLKVELNRRDVSMTDCIGYSLANQLGIKFLTGDKEFENMDNVEFVRK